MMYLVSYSGESWEEMKMKRNMLMGGKALALAALLVCGTAAFGTGYEMTTRLTVSNIPIDKAGTIISESVAAGVNGIDSVSYFSSNYDASYQEALKGAMAVAKAKADALAEASGKSIVGVAHVEEFGYNPYVRNSSFSGAAVYLERIRDWAH